MEDQRQQPRAAEGELAQDYENKQSPGCGPSDAAAAPFAALPPELWPRVAAFLQPNDVALGLRLAFKTAADVLKERAHRTVHLSQRVPPPDFARRWSAPDALRTLNRKQRAQQLASLVAASGVVANLEVLAARRDVPPLCGPSAEWEPLLRAAAGAGQLAVCRWLVDRGCPRGERAVTAAAAAGQADVVAWLFEGGLGCCALQAARAAARHGHVGLMDAMLQRCEPRARAQSAPQLAVEVAHGCDLATLQRVHAAQVHGRDDAIACLQLCLAAASATPDWAAKIQWLVQALGVDPAASPASAYAAHAPDGAARLAWLRQRGFPLRPPAVAAAISDGRVEALRFLLDAGVGVDPWAAEGAARNGHLDVLRLLLLHARKGSAVQLDAQRLLVRAAEGGHLPVVAWVVEELGAGAVLGVPVAQAAAGAGSMELLAWLRGRGCPWDASVLSAAAAHGSEEQLEWLAAHGCPMRDDGAPYMVAARCADAPVIRCLRCVGCPWDADTFRGAAVACWREAASLADAHGDHTVDFIHFWQPALLALRGVCGPVDWAGVRGAWPGDPAYGEWVEDLEAM